ncbi:MAG: hypothetical protein ACXWP5_13010 [Bdellovibrionota bacterium]
MKHTRNKSLPRPNPSKRPKPKKKRQIALLMLFGTIASPAGLTGEHADRLSSAKEKYPYGLIGDDFGLLTEEDLAVNTCDVFPEKFSPESTSFPYWQCFSTKRAFVECDDAGYDESEKAPIAILVITTQKQHEKHESLSRRAIHWIFDKFKSNLGCDPYFAGGCSLKYQLERGCQITQAGR